jgi:hypothetical protein
MMSEIIDMGAWMPTEVGQELTGEVTDIDTAWSDYKNAEYPLLTIVDDEGGEWKLHAFRTVLLREVMKWKPQVGERVTVRYAGQGKVKAGLNAPEIYRVRVEGRASTSAQDAYRRIERQPPAPDVPVDAPEEELPF